MTQRARKGAGRRRELRQGEREVRLDVRLEVSRAGGATGDDLEFFVLETEYSPTRANPCTPGGQLCKSGGFKS